MRERLGKLIENEDNVKQILKTVHINMPWRYIPRYLPIVLEMGLNIEIAFEAEHLDNGFFRDFEVVSEKLQGAGCRVSLHGPFWDLCPGSSDTMIRQVSRLRISQFFDLIPVFWPLTVVCHTGYDPRHHGRDFRPWLERALRVWETFVVRAEQLKVPFLLENVWEPDPSLHRQLFDYFRSPYCGLCLDVGHQHAFSDVPLSLWLEVLLPELQELHLHDNDGSRDEHLPIGQGSINFLLLFDTLRRWGKKPLITLEPHKEEHLVETLQGLARLGYVKGLLGPSI